MNAGGARSPQPPDGARNDTGQTDLLAIVLTAYQDVLGAAQVRPEDDFFGLGGDSIQAIDAVTIIEAALGTEVSPALFFTYPTAAELASALSDTRSGT
jgi:acyl carrier protein